jgi:GntR family transcriptional regulator
VTVNALDRSSPMPLWAQLELELRRRLDAGEFDSAFPTDMELTQTYEVSRHTVREAIRHLNRTGVLRRERGRGTVVNRAEFEQPLGTLYSLYRSGEATGVAQTSDVLRLELVVEEGAAIQLGLEPDTELVFLERLRMAGGSPLAVDRAWLPASFARPLLDVDWRHTALYDELARFGAPVPNQGWERLTPIIPAASDRQLLGLRKSDAAFFLERLGSHDGTPIEWRTTVIRGDRYRFVSDWSAGNRAELRPESR